MSDLDRCYEVLGLEPGASPEEVKRAYHDLVLVWHPDRFSDNPRLQQKAEEKLKEINHAYTLLRSFRLDPIRPETRQQQKRKSQQPSTWTCVCGVKHIAAQSRCWKCGRRRDGSYGRPPQGEPRAGAGRSRAGAGEATRGPKTSPSYEETRPRDVWECGCGVTNPQWRNRCSGCGLDYAEAMRRTRQGQKSAYSPSPSGRASSSLSGSGYLFFVLAFLLIRVLRMASSEPQTKPKTAPPSTSVSIQRQMPTLGMEGLSEIPASGNRAENDRSHANRNGGESHFGTPESTEEKVANTVPPRGYITVGSTKDEVLAVQGPPDTFTDTSFEYGTSYIHFEDDRVVGWYNSYPSLKVKMLPATLTTKTYITVGSTKDEVLAIQGTPDTFTRASFKYGNSYIHFKDDRVVSWVNSYPSLKVKMLPQQSYGP